MVRGWKRIALDADTALVPYPTAVLQMDQATSADQGILRNQRERGEDSTLDRRQRRCARRHRPQTARTGGHSLNTPTDSQPDSFREDAHLIDTSAV